MRVLVFDAHSYDQTFLNQANQGQHDLVFTSSCLDLQTVAMCRDFEAIICFVNDDASAPVLTALAQGATRMIALRCTGFNRVHLETAKSLGIRVARVLNYSPYSVAEHAVALLQTLNRHTHRAYNRTRDFNFRLAGLMGRDLHGQTVGVVGTGKIGAAFAQIMHGFGCKLLAYDQTPNERVLALGARYCPLEELLSSSDIVSLHVPLTPATKHMINEKTLKLIRNDAFLINTSRGGLVDTHALITEIRAGRFAGVGLDVYEEEEGKFFRDLSETVMTDEILAQLMTFPNVLVTGHQAFFTREAVGTIAATTIQNLNDFVAARTNENFLV